MEFSAQLLLGHDAEDAIKTGITPEGFDIVCHVQNTGVQEVGPSGKVMDEHVIIAENSLVVMLVMSTESDTASMALFCSLSPPAM